MTKDWIPVIATLLGTLLGSGITYLAALVRLKKEERSEKRAIILEKLEQTHEVARSIRQVYREEHGYALDRLTTGVPERRDEPPRLVEIDRLQMLVGFYFPELFPAVEALESSRESFGAILAGTLIPPEPPEIREEMMESLRQRYHHLDNTCRELLEATAALASKYTKF